MRTCANEGCNNTFTPHPKAPHHTFCSPACRTETRRRLERSTDTWKACAGPGCPNAILPRQANQRFCSRNCRRKLERMRASNTPLERRCAICRELFTPKRTQKYCSAACRQERNRQVDRKRKKQYREANRESLNKYNAWYRSRYLRATPDKRQCKGCEVEFEPQPNQLYCDKTCKRHSLRRGNLEKRREQDRRYRQRHSEALRQKQRDRYRRNREAILAKARARYRQRKRKQ